MKKHLAAIRSHYRTHSRRIWILVIVALVVLYFVFHNQKVVSVSASPVSFGTLASTVHASGQVTSNTDLSLSFSQSGEIATLPAVVGKKVSRGQILASLSNRAEYAALLQAQANYEKVVDGASNEDIATSLAALNSAKAALATVTASQNTIVDNAHRALLNADLTAYLISGTGGVTAPTVSGTYTDPADASYTLTLYPTGSDGYFTYTGPEKGIGSMSSSAPKPIGTKGLFVIFAEPLSAYANQRWTVSLPNKASPNYLAAYNTYQNSLTDRDNATASAQNAVASAQADLDFKRAAARPADLAIAQAQVAAANANYEKTVLRAPASGTVVHVDTKVGERADAQKEIIVIQDIGSLYVEAKINETNIARIALGQSVDLTLDAFGPDVHFTGTVIHIDPSSTTQDGVVNYLVKMTITDRSKTHRILPGMNANVVITAWSHPNVIAVPKAAITYNLDGSASVDVVVDENGRMKTKTRVITTGARGDGDMVEVTSGLSARDKVALKGNS